LLSDLQQVVEFVELRFPERSVARYPFLRAGHTRGIHAYEMRSAAAATPNQSRVFQYAQMPRNSRQRDAKRPSQFRNATFALSGKTLQDAAPSRIRERGKNRRNRLSFIKQRLKPNSSKKQSQYDI
jgi:hypothetical protein